MAASGPSLPRLAWRNLWRHRRRTLLTVSSIAFGTFFAIFFTSIQDHSFGEMIDLAARMGGGHVTLQHPEYLDSPTLSRTVRNPGLEALAREDSRVERVVTRIAGHIMLSTADQNYGAGFIAYDPTVEGTSTLSVLEALADGRGFETADEAGIILGWRLADNLDTRIGRKVVFTLTDRQGEIVRDVGRVTGLLRTGSPSADAALALFPIDRMRNVLGYHPDEAVHVAVFLSDQRRAADVAERLGPALGDGAAALAWYEVNPDLAAFISMKVASAQFMEILIMLLVAAGIFNTLFVSVMERRREFGIMLALGFTPSALFRMVMYESGWLAGVGLAAGAALTAWPYYYLNQTGVDLLALIGADSSEVAGVAVTGVMKADIYPEHLVLILLAVLAATLLSGIYPAWKAGRVDPVETIQLV